MTRVKTVAKWIFLLLPSVAVISIAAIAIITRLVPDRRPERFVAHWAELFRGVSTPDDLTGICAEDRPDLIFTRRFPSGEWVMARTEYSCSDGAGFDATVFRDSSGGIQYQMGHHFCGFEGLCRELNSPGATNVAGFFDSLKSIDFREWEMNDQPTGGAAVARGVGTPSARP